MCGITGLVWKTAAGRRIEDFRRASELLAHRGPDGRGEYLDERILLIHFRLAILDLSPAGWQPFEVMDTRSSLGVYNGELYNYRELADSYQIKRQTSCDTEVVLKGIAQYGTAILSKYNGIFALAQYFPQDKELLLARDRLGVKPLYFIETSDYFAFASEAKVLYAFMDVLQLNAGVLRNFLSFGSSMSIQTLVDGVRKLEAGHYLRLDLDTNIAETASYWTVHGQFETVVARSSYAESKVHAKILLDEAVKRQCLSDVPIGAYLSGGLDSSMIVALAARHSGSPIKTFSVRFEGSPNSELPLARQVAERYGTEHFEMEISPGDLIHDLERLVLQYDEPFADPAALPLHLMAVKCAPFAKVILQGDGGDELFAGYGRHLDMSQFRRRLLAFGLLSKVHPKRNARERFAKRFGDLSAFPLSVRLARLSGSLGEDVFLKVLSGAMQDRVRSSILTEIFERAAVCVADKDPVSQILMTDMVAILPHTFLEKVDKVSMWHGVEARVPFLDNELVDYLIGLPSRYKIREGTTKALLREIASEFLPDEVVRGRKQSFGTPMDIWLRTLLFEFAQNVFREGREIWEDIFDFDQILLLHKQHLEGKADHTAVLWRLVVLMIWLKHYRGKIQIPGLGGYFASGTNGA